MFFSSGKPVSRWSSYTSDSSIASSKESQRHLLSPPSSSPNWPHPHQQTLSRRLVDLFFWTTQGILALAGLYLLYRLVVTLGDPSARPVRISYLSTDGSDRMLNASILPPDPAAIIIETPRNTSIGNALAENTLAGNTSSRWTVAIPHGHDFPLRPSVHANLCAQATNTSRHLVAMRTGRKMVHFPYYHVDQNFVGVKEAEALEFVGVNENEAGGWQTVVRPATSQERSIAESNGVCNRSLTYVLEGPNAGFGNIMMGMWMAYGLAQRENRTFFIDDRNWAYGSYTSYFAPPPAPTCLPAPDHHRLPCPHQAAHFLISAGTTSHAFGYQFNDEFEDARKMEVMRQHRIFALLRAGHDALFRLAESDANEVEQRITELKALAGEQNGGSPWINIQVRHGDKRPREYAYSNTCLPPVKYINEAAALARDLTNHSSAMPLLSLASDDPAVYTLPEFSTARSNDAGTAPGAGTAVSDLPTRFQFGFTAAAFWALDPHAPALGADAPLPFEVAEARARAPVDASIMNQRKAMARAYVRDVAVGSAADGVVCGGGTIACRLLAVGLGWEVGIVQRGWRNVDGQFGWTGIVW